jgi:hypothetical protein
MLKKGYAGWFYGVAFQWIDAQICRKSRMISTSSIDKKTTLRALSNISIKLNKTALSICFQALLIRSSRQFD